MSNEIKYLYRLLTGIILFLSNNEFTWKIINYFASFNGEPGKVLSTFNRILVIVSLLGLIIALLNAALLFLLTFNKEKKG